MGILHHIDRRSESRTHANFSVTVWGVDTRGERFLQEAQVRDISFNGALLSGIEADLRCGDVIGLLYLSRKARYRVVWVRYDDMGEKIQAAIHRMEADPCPWDELPKAESAAHPALPRAELPSDSR
ncbi:MAG: PilZ domain-containing protein [Candidatus Sulfotelmatobacter sp.]